MVKYHLTEPLPECLQGEESETNTSHYCPNTPETYNQQLSCDPQSACDKPCKPHSIKAVVENNYILLQWDKPVSDGGCDIFNYNIRIYYCPEYCSQPNDNLQVFPDCSSPRNPCE